MRKKTTRWEFAFLQKEERSCCAEHFHRGQAYGMKAIAGLVALASPTGMVVPVVFPPFTASSAGALLCAADKSQSGKGSFQGVGGRIHLVLGGISIRRQSFSRISNSAHGINTVLSVLREINRLGRADHLVEDDFAGLHLQLGHGVNPLGDGNHDFVVSCAAALWQFLRGGERIQEFPSAGFPYGSKSGLMMFAISTATRKAICRLAFNPKPGHDSQQIDGGIIDLGLGEPFLWTGF